MRVSFLKHYRTKKSTVFSFIFFSSRTVFKRQCQQKVPELESGGSADRLGTNFFGFRIKIDSPYKLKIDFYDTESKYFLTYSTQ